MWAAGIVYDFNQYKSLFNLNKELLRIDARCIPSFLLYFHLHTLLDTSEKQDGFVLTCNVDSAQIKPPKVLIKSIKRPYTERRALIFLLTNHILVLASLLSSVSFISTNFKYRAERTFGICAFCFLVSQVKTYNVHVLAIAIYGKTILIVLAMKFIAMSMGLNS